MKWERRRVRPPAFFVLLLQFQTIFESISYFISHCKISIIHRIIADRFQFLRVDLAIRQDAFLRIDVDDIAHQNAIFKTFHLALQSHGKFIDQRCIDKDTLGHMETGMGYITGFAPKFTLLIFILLGLN